MKPLLLLEKFALPATTLALCVFLNGCSKGCSKPQPQTDTPKASSSSPSSLDKTAPSKTQPSVVTQSAPSGATGQNITKETTAPKEIVTAKEENKCFVSTFIHKKTKGHSDDEECSKHKNLFKLQDKDLNKKSLCVKVDGTPVRFQTIEKKESSGIVIGPDAGPGSKVTISYCVGKSKCAFDCKLPKDEFMDALGASDSDRKPSKWNADDKPETDVAVDKDIAKEILDNNDLVTFDGWSAQSQESVCKK